MFYDRGNRPGFHIFIISARSRNVKYILTENVPVKRFALSPGLFVIGLRPPRNDKLENFTPQNVCRKDCQPAWRSGNAATDAIGFYIFIGNRHES